MGRKTHLEIRLESGGTLMILIPCLCAKPDNKLCFIAVRYLLSVCDSCFALEEVPGLGDACCVGLR